MPSEQYLKDKEAKERWRLKNIEHYREYQRQYANSKYMERREKMLIYKQRKRDYEKIAKIFRNILLDDE